MINTSSYAQVLPIKSQCVRLSSIFVPILHHINVLNGSNENVTYEIIRAGKYWGDFIFDLGKYRVQTRDERQNNCSRYLSGHLPV